MSNSPQLPREAVVRVSFDAVAAGFDEFASQLTIKTKKVDDLTASIEEIEAAETQQMRLTMRQLNRGMPGKARFQLSLDRVALGSVYIRSIKPDRTYIAVKYANDFNDEVKTTILELLKSTMWQFINWLHNDQLRMSEIDETTVALMVNPPQPENIPLPRVGTNEPPSENASIDEWLDWRERERERGRKVSLTRVAELSMKSESTLKKRSAERNRQEP